MVLEQLRALIDVIRSSELLERSAAAGVIAIGGLLGGYFLGRIVGLVIRKFGWIEKVRGLGVRNPEAYVESIVRYIVYVIAFVFALNRLGLVNAFISIAAIIIIAVIAIFLVLTFRDAFANLSAGILLHSRHPVLKPGVKIKAGNVRGELKYFGWLETKVVTAKGDTVVIPNSFLLEHKPEIEIKLK